MYESHRPRTAPKRGRPRRRVARRCSSPRGPARRTARSEDALAPLVAEALASNVEMAAGEATVAQRLAELDVARAQYLPVLDLSARYSRADGGRTIDFRRRRSR